MADHATCVTQETMPEPDETKPKSLGKKQQKKKREEKKQKKRKKKGKTDENKRKKEMGKVKKDEKNKKKVTVTVGTTGGSARVEGLIALLRDMEDVKAVNFQEIPYNIADMDQFDFDDVDVFILCHSINNRRLSITDVTDALYDRLLWRAFRAIGKRKVNIVAYDFNSDELQADVLASKLKSFEIMQPTACKMSSVVLFAGQCASSPPELPGNQLDKLCSSLKAASRKRRNLFCCIPSCRSNRR